MGDDVRKLLEDTQTVYHAAKRTQPTSRTKALQEADSIRKAEPVRRGEDYGGRAAGRRKNVKESQKRSQKQIIESAQQSAAQLRKGSRLVCHWTAKHPWSRPMQRVRAILSRLQEASKVLDNAYQSDANLTPLQSSQLRRDAPTPVIAGQATNPDGGGS